MEVDAQGDLVLHIADEQIRLHKPLVYQEADGVRREIFGGYVLKGKYQVGFQSLEISEPFVMSSLYGVQLTIRQLKARGVKNRASSSWSSQIMQIN